MLLLIKLQWLKMMDRMEMMRKVMLLEAMQEVEAMQQEVEAMLVVEVMQDRIKDRVIMLHNNKIRIMDQKMKKRKVMMRIKMDERI
mgnify:CR=1 FL=1